MAKLCNAGANWSLGKWWLWALLGLLALFLLMQYFKWRPIEADVQSRTQAELNADGHAWAKVDLHDRGRDVLLTGQAPSHQAVDDAMKLASGVEGVRIVDHQTSLIEWLSSKVGITQNQNKTLLSGSVPSQAVANELFSGVSKVVGAGNVENQLLISDTASKPAWLGKLMASLPVLGTLRNASIQAEDGQFSVSGDVEDEQEKQSILSAISRQFGNNYSGEVKVVSTGPTAAEIAAEKLRQAEERRRLAAEAAAEAQRNAAEQTRLAEENMLQLEKQRADDEAHAAYLAKQKEKEDRTAFLVACQIRINDLMSGAKIQFDSGSAKISSASNGLLNTISGLLKECVKDDQVKIQIAGHTDSTGDDALNLNLSINRANAVMEHLAKLGVFRSILSAVGHGEFKPIADNATEAGRAANRRIQFHIK